MHDRMYPLPSEEFSHRRRELTPEVDKAQTALRDGASEREIMEAIWVASEMRAGAAFAHSNIALEAMADAAHR